MRIDYLKDLLVELEHEECLVIDGGSGNMKVQGQAANTAHAGSNLGTTGGVGGISTPWASGGC